MNRLGDLELNGDMDLIIQDNDLKMDPTLKTHARIAIQCSDDWWANSLSQNGSLGCGIYDIYKKGKLSNNEIKLIKQESDKALSQIKNYSPDIKSSVIKNEDRAIIVVNIDTNNRIELWKFQQ